MTLNLKLKVGKIRVTSPKYPSESGFVQSVRAQLDELEEIVNSFFDQVVVASPYIAQDALQPTFAKSKEWCPKKTGAMVASGYLEITSLSKVTPRVEMGYGRGGNPFYTVFVHEQVNMYHKPPTRAKWLQAAMLEDLTVLWKRLSDGYNSFTAIG
jgi:hypothetical protein